jgi:hypothetical protein
MQLLIIVLLGSIVASLGHALSCMASGPDRAARMAKALTVRISLSVVLFALLLVGYRLGWIQPHAMR